MTSSRLAFSTLVIVAAQLCAPASGSAQSILQSAGNYALLGGTLISVGGPGPDPITNGNVGLYSAATSNITGFPPATVSGVTLSGAGAAIIATGALTTGQAMADLQTAHTRLAAMPSNANYTNRDLASLGAIPSGVYTFNATASLTGALVLDAQGKNNVFWVFQIGTALTTAANSSVTLINPGSNGGKDDGIFWNAGTSITIGDNNAILGNYIAGTSISFSGITTTSGTGGSRALALAAISFAGPAAINALGGPGGNDWSGGLTYNGNTVVATATISNPGHLVNLSILSNIQASLSMGFVLGGSGTSGSETLLIRGVGPSIGPGTAFNVPGVLPDPILTVVQQSSHATVNSNSGWGGNAAVTTADSATGAFPLTNTSSADSAVVASLPPVAGGYSATVAGKTGDGGYALTEVYDDTPNYIPSDTRLVNLSCLTQVAAGASLNVGFVLGGTTAKTVLVRVSGPTLAVAPFNIGGTMPDPQLVIAPLSNSSGVLAANAGWGGNTVVASVAASVGAFAFAGSASKDSAILITLQPNIAYTATVSSVSGTGGYVLVELYDASP